MRWPSEPASTPAIAPASAPSSPARPSPSRAPTVAPTSSASAIDRSLRRNASMAPSLVLLHGEHVDQADLVVVTQVRELVEDLAGEVRPVEGDHEQLDRSDGHAGLLGTRGSVVTGRTGRSARRAASLLGVELLLRQDAGVEEALELGELLVLVRRRCRGRGAGHGRRLPRPVPRRPAAPRPPRLERHPGFEATWAVAPRTAARLNMRGMGCSFAGAGARRPAPRRSHGFRPCSARRRPVCSPARALTRVIGRIGRGLVENDTTSRPRSKSWRRTPCTCAWSVSGPISSVRPSPAVSVIPSTASPKRSSSSPATTIVQMTIRASCAHRGSSRTTPRALTRVVAPSPLARSRAIAASRDVTPSLRYAAFRWDLTVLYEMKSCSAISRCWSPSAARRSTTTSRSDSASPNSVGGAPARPAARAGPTSAPPARRGRGAGPGSRRRGRRTSSAAAR